MSNSAWIDPRIDAVRVDGVRSYLLDHGWELQSYPGPELLVFGGFTDDDGQPVTQVVPSSEHLSDFRLRVEELITALSIMEDRPAAEVLRDILAAGETGNGAAATKERGASVTPP